MLFRSGRHGRHSLGTVPRVEVCLTKHRQSSQGVVLLYGDTRPAQESAACRDFAWHRLRGFVDGIVLHQILQWHNMLSNWMPPTTLETMHVNMVWDGLFHAVVWLVTLVGVLPLERGISSGADSLLREFVGRLLFGWGWFNLVEGILDHQLLGVHYVRQVANYTVYNLTFLAIGGVGFILVGWVLMRTGRRMS